MSLLRSGIALALIGACSIANAEDQRTPTVGMAARIEQIVLPGTELEPKPLEDDRTPIVLRVVGTFRHGDAYRYDLEYYALEPGKHDLKKYLKRKDGSSTADLPSIVVDVKPILPPGQIQPNALQVGDSSSLGGYRVLKLIAIAFWVLGFFAIIFVGRKSTIRRVKKAEKPLSLADRLRPLVNQARTGKLDTREQAELERMLITFWQQRLELSNQHPAEAIATLRSHGEAGQLLRELESWLHKPNPSTDVNVEELLKPYQELSAEEIGATAKGGQR